jgi:hypothetical protein
VLNKYLIDRAIEKYESLLLLDIISISIVGTLALSSLLISEIHIKVQGKIAIILH